MNLVSDAKTQKKDKGFEMRCLHKTATSWEEIVNGITLKSVLNKKMIIHYWQSCDGTLNTYVLCMDPELLPYICLHSRVQGCKHKELKRYRKIDFYSAPLWEAHLWSAQVWITVFTLQTHHTCLHLVSVHQTAPPLTIVIAAIWLQLTTRLSIPRGWKAELA